MLLPSAFASATNLVPLTAPFSYTPSAQTMSHDPPTGGMGRARNRLTFPRQTLPHRHWRAQQVAPLPQEGSGAEGTQFIAPETFAPELTAP